MHDDAIHRYLIRHRVTEAQLLEKRQVELLPLQPSREPWIRIIEIHAGQRSGTASPDVVPATHTVTGSPGCKKR